MKDEEKSKEQLIEELLEIRKRIADLEKSKTEPKLAGEKTKEEETERLSAEQAGKQAEENLRQEKIYAEQLIDTSNAMIVGLDTAGNIAIFNSAAEHITGYSKAEAIGKNWFEVFVPKDMYPYVWEKFEEWQKGKPLIDIAFDNPILTKQGKVRHIAWRNSERKYLNTITGIISFGVDITERKEAEEALRNSEKTIRALLDATNDTVFLIDTSGTILVLNETFARRLGKTVDETIGCCAYDFLSPETAKARKGIIDEAIRSGKPARFEDERQGMWFDNNIYPIFDDKGKVVKVAVYARNITERKQMEVELRSLSLLDELTGLYNRRGFMTLAEQELKVASRKKIGMLMIFADLDRMKWINDTFGHREGDRALIEAAEVLKETFRESDIIGRIGGDEFAMLAIDTPELTIEILTTRLQDNLEIHNKRGVRSYELSLSIGITHYNPDTPCSLEELTAQADTLMYEEKRRKQNLQ
jgi:diguanylate cyclase (GGDEF)-like protein/PAS domain S-box-containing protein